VSNDGVPLTSVLGIIQGHSNWHHSIDHTRLHIRYSCRYDGVWYYFWLISCWKYCELETE